MGLLLCLRPDEDPVRVETGWRFYLCNNAHGLIKGFYTKDNPCRPVELPEVGPSANSL